MQKKITNALISVFNKEGLETIVNLLANNGVTIYSTGGTQGFIEKQNIPCTPVESLTNYPSILGGRVKTLHPKVFGGILGRRHNEQDLQEMAQYEIPPFDLVIVDLYPFEQTLATTNDHALIIEKIDIGGPSMIRAAAKNHQDVVVLASKADYAHLTEILQSQACATTLEQRHYLATRAFQVVAQYDIAIANWFLQKPDYNVLIQPINGQETHLRYGENPHQKASFYGNLQELFTQLHGKEISYNNLVDIDASLQLITEFTQPTFSIIKHTNPCGIASAATTLQAWQKALAADPESAFGGVLCTNHTIDADTANAINEIFFEVCLAPQFTPEALAILQQKKNRILLQTIQMPAAKVQIKTLLNGILVQDADAETHAKWQDEGSQPASEQQKIDLEFANIVCKHLKSNAIAIVKNQQLIGKGCGQTSRIDALKYAIKKAQDFGFDLQNASLASDAFFPFDDCITMAHEAGINAFIQPGGSIRDADSITYAKNNNLVMVLTGTRHFKH